jgi:hypothetical protein
MLINGGDKVENIKLIATKYGYNFYTGIDKNGKTLYNVVPDKEGAPGGGYYSPAYICRVKNLPNLFLKNLEVTP